MKWLHCFVADVCLEGGYVAKPLFFCYQKGAKACWNSFCWCDLDTAEMLFFFDGSCNASVTRPHQSDIIRPWGSFSEAGFHGMLWNVGCRILTPLILSSNVMQCSPVGSWCPRASHWCKLVNLTIVTSLMYLPKILAMGVMFTTVG